MTDSFAGLFPMSVGRDGKFSGFLFKVFDHIFILRFMLIIPVWTVLLLGFYHSGSGLPFTWRMFAIAAAATGLAGAVFVFNQIFDIESDRINDKVYFLPKKYVTITAAYILYLVLNIISLVIAFMVSAIAGFLGGAILLLGAAYSAPPFVIKDRPGWVFWPTPPDMEPWFFYWDIVHWAAIWEPAFSNLCRIFYRWQPSISALPWPIEKGTNVPAK
jgi:hypothetical protein